MKEYTQTGTNLKLHSSLIHPQLFSLQMHIILISLLSLQLNFFTCKSQSVLPLPLNGFLNGTTIGAKKEIFLNFSQKDFTEAPVGSGGQRIFVLNITGENEETNIQISTCLGSDFDTYLAVLDGNPINTSDVSVVSEGGNDLTCRTGRSKAFLSTKITAGAYFLIVTGNGDEEGFFNITITSSKATPTPVPWGLDRIDQRKLPLNAQYQVRDSGDDVWVYLVDSGIRTSHEEFEGRAEEGYDFVNNERDSAFDCTGHGTHVAGIIAGKTYGVSRKSHITAIRVFGCDNQAKASALVDAIGWILVDSKIKGRENIVVTMMFSTRDKESTILRTTVKGLIRAGIPVVVPAGNNAEDACGFFPGSNDEFFTVGSTDSKDDLSLFSNTGNCTNMYAPGTSIASSWHTSDTSWRNMSGTAQAAAHMVGIIANFISLNPNVEAMEVKNVVESISSRNVVRGVPQNSTSRFAYVRSVPRFVGSPPPKPNVYLFFVLGVPFRFCQGDSDLSSLQKFTAELLSVKISNVISRCLPALGTYREGEKENVELRVELSEKLAAATFILLENALVFEREEWEDSMGYPIDVVEMPWAVDSNPVVYWGAPSFAGTESSSVSAGALAGAIVGACCLVAILATAAWIIYRKMTKADVFESMEGSADFDREPVKFDDYKDAGGDNSVPRSFRNVFKAMKGMRTSSFYGNATGQQNGLNKMGSFIGGPNSMVAKDVVRLNSIGGEAFAGLNDLSRLDSCFEQDTDQGSSSKNLALSFRGLNNLVLKSNRRKKNEEDGPLSSMSYTDDSLRMQSLGGEAFAQIGRQLSMDARIDLKTPDAESASEPSHDPQPETSVLPDAYGTNAASSDGSSQRELSFFGGTASKPR